MRRLTEEKAASVSFVGGGACAPTRCEYEVELITPMFGGDTQSWEPNKTRPIRESSVKGHLRFWWRTMQPPMKPAALKEAENALFGSTGAASKVSISIAYPVEPTVQHFQFSPRGVTGTDRGVNYPIYALFPLIPRGQGTGVTKCTFRLTVTMTGLKEEQEDSVRNALKLWLLFGGVGARTRRGCGSLYCEEVMSEFPDMRAVQGFVNSLVSQQSPSPAWYPRLAGARITFKKGSSKEPVEDWEHLIRDYKDFRQSRNPGTQQGRPGRSHWPEPDSIRRITGDGASNHTPKHGAGNWFPRAAYGMPVQFEFRNAEGDPRGKFFVQPVDKERWASPVILKVIQFGKESHGRLCLVLNQRIPQALELKRDKYSIRDLKEEEHPDNHAGRLMLEKDEASRKENPYETLIRKLNIKEA